MYLIPIHLFYLQIKKTLKKKIGAVPFKTRGIFGTTVAQAMGPAMTLPSVVHDAMSWIEMSGGNNICSFRKKKKKKEKPVD
jgi:hypothetical protein